tara:strand:- start:1635 stop:1934 length:300 start_codon:yes stop_codon:yes gene_type:complete
MKLIAKLFKMSAEELTNAVSIRICNHMNSDHKNALFQYAVHYGGVIDCKEVFMTKITSDYLELEVDKELIKIPFDHSLRDREDAHGTLVRMIKELPKEA